MASKAFSSNLKVSIMPGMRTLLLRPPPLRRLAGGFRVPPLGLLSLASSLLQHGHPVAFLDAAAEGLSWLQTKDHVRRMRPDMLGIGVLTPVREVAYHAARVLRPYVRHLVLGGPHVTACRAGVFDECPEADYLVIGEGEQAVVDLAQALDHARPVRIRGVLSRSWDGGPAARMILDDLPSPAFHLLPLRAYHHPLAARLPMCTMVTSRGCPGRCTFCDQAVSGGRWRAHGVARVLSDLHRLEALGVRHVAFYDDNFVVDRDRVMHLCRGMIDEGIRLPWKCEARVDMVDRELLRACARAGCRMMAFGVETAHQEGLDRLGKGTTVEQARDALRWARQAGIETLAYVLVGIPGESPAHVARTLEFCLAEKVSVIQVSTLSVLPGTALWEEARDRGWHTAGHLRGVFDDETVRTTIVPPGWTSETLARALAHAHRRAYLRPRFVLGSIARCRTLPQAAGLLRETARGMPTLAREILLNRPR